MYQELVPVSRDASSVPVAPGTDDYGSTHEQWPMISNSRKMGDETVAFVAKVKIGKTLTSGEDKEFLDRLSATREFKAAEILGAEASNRRKGADFNVEAGKQLSQVLKKLNEKKEQIAVDIARKKPADPYTYTTTEPMGPKLPAQIRREDERRYYSSVGEEELDDW
jgi:hypothetical protein